MTLFTDANVSPPPHGYRQPDHELTLFRAEYADALIVPLSFIPKSSRPLKNSMKPVALIPVVDVDAGTQDPMQELRTLIRQEAELAKVPATPQFITNSVSNLLKAFQAGYEIYLKQKQGTGDLVYESKLPSGRRIVFARTQTLRMCGLLT